jgi:hypothetical protein
LDCSFCLYKCRLKEIAEKASLLNSQKSKTMIGFKIEGKGEKLSVASDAIHVIIALLAKESEEELSLHIRGSNDFFQERLNWGAIKLEPGDEFLIKVEEIEDISKPKKKEFHECSEERLKEELKTYFALKQELEDANWI